MKRMKKTVALAMAAVMMMSMAACAKKADPKEVFDSAVKKNADLKDVDMSINSTVNMTQGDQKIDITSKTDMKMNNLDTDKLQYLADSTATMSGQSVPSTVFYKDGYEYISSQGQKIKYKMDLAKMVETIKKSTQGTNMTSADMKTLTMKEDGDNKVLTFTADPSKMNSMIEDMMGSMGAFGTQLKDLKMNIKDVSGEYTVNKDGYYTGMKIKMDMDMTLQGQTISMSIDMDGVVNNPGKPVEITLPDTNGYQEVQAPAGSTSTESGSEAETAQESTAA